MAQTPLHPADNPTISATNDFKTTADSSPAAKTVGILSLLVTAYIHFLDLSGKLSETPYLGYGYILLMVGSLVAAGLLLFRRERQGWLLGGALALGAIVAYLLSRTVGLPYATDDIGNWVEPLGVYSLVAEGVMVTVSAWALSRHA